LTTSIAPGFASAMPAWLALALDVALALLGVRRLNPSAHKS